VYESRNRCSVWERMMVLRGHRPAGRSMCERRYDDHSPSSFWPITKWNNKLHFYSLYFETVQTIVFTPSSDAFNLVFHTADSLWCASVGSQCRAYNFGRYCKHKSDDANYDVIGCNSTTNPQQINYKLITNRDYKLQISQFVLSLTARHLRDISIQTRGKSCEGNGNLAN